MKPIASLLALAATLSTVHGTVLLSYEFTGLSLNPTTTTNPGLLTGGAVTNANLGLFRVQNISEANSFWVPDSLQTRPRAGMTTLENSVANNMYFSITVTPQAAVDLTSLAFNFDTSNTSFPSGLTIRSSATGTTNLAEITVATQSRANPGSYDLNLTGFSELQDVTDPVTFMFYIHNLAGASTVTIEFDDIKISGVPEPTTPLLFGGACALMMLKRRRK